MGAFIYIYMHIYKYVCMHMNGILVIIVYDHSSGFDILLKNQTDIILRYPPCQVTCNRFPSVAIASMSSVYNIDDTKAGVFHWKIRQHGGVNDQQPWGFIGKHRGIHWTYLSDGGPPGWAFFSGPTRIGLGFALW